MLVMGWDGALALELDALLALGLVRGLDEMLARELGGESVQG